LGGDGIVSFDWDDEDSDDVGTFEDPDALPEKRVPDYFRWIAALLAFSLLAYFANLFFRLVL
jgi:hypothetical protein